MFARRLTELPRALSIITAIAGLVGLVGCVLFAIKQYPVGKGFTERVAAYPATLWLFAFGAFVSINHYAERRRRTRGRSRG